ncbi:hypothetical protein ASD53_13135 [Lysobacter sp. Root559]|uniref:hypothetical protein n=1 Tax=Lysobacter sp. Root559 TaxID=1736559 RepID=UPI000715BA7F|nr:hypothetical protein [Lysobacter sp. Root559]KQZ56482.1 hypothetical protein ASD53_13135 [Lysobacter sp. Root559]
MVVLMRGGVPCDMETAAVRSSARRAAALGGGYGNDDPMCAGVTSPDLAFIAAPPAKLTAAAARRW